MGRGAGARVSAGVLANRVVVDIEILLVRSGWCVSTVGRRPSPCQRGLFPDPGWPLPTSMPSLPRPCGPSVRAGCLSGRRPRSPRSGVCLTRTSYRRSRASLRPFPERNARRRLQADCPAASIVWSSSLTSSTSQSPQDPFAEMPAREARSAPSPSQGHLMTRPWWESAADGRTPRTSTLSHGYQRVVVRARHP